MISIESMGQILSKHHHEQTTPDLPGSSAFLKEMITLLKLYFGLLRCSFEI